MDKDKFPATKEMLESMSSAVLRSHKERFSDILTKKPAVSFEDKCCVVVNTVDKHLSETEVGYVNLSRFLYLIANLENLKGSFRRRKCIKRSNLVCAKLRGFENKVAKQFEVLSNVDIVQYKDRYEEVMDGLSQLALGTLTNYKDINKVKKAFTDTLTKNRSTAFFNINKSSRVLPNKYPVFNSFLYRTVQHGAIPLSEIATLALINEYISPYSALFKTAQLYSVLYVRNDGSPLHTELNAVCDVNTNEYFTLVESSSFKLLLFMLFEIYGNSEMSTRLFVDTMSDMCALYFTTKDESTGSALHKLKQLTSVRFLAVL